jgi:hypothetical protein
MLREFNRALKKDKQYLTPLQRCAFIGVGLIFIASAVILVLAAIESHRYRLLLLAIPLIPFVGWGNAMIWAAIHASPEYRSTNH